MRRKTGPPHGLIAPKLMERTVAVLAYPALLYVDKEEPNTAGTVQELLMRSSDDGDLMDEDRCMKVQSAGHLIP